MRYAILMFKVRDNGALEMDFKCVLRCAVAPLSLPSLKKISESITITSTFHFSGVDKTGVEKVVANLNSSEVGTFKNIPTKCF